MRHISRLFLKCRIWFLNLVFLRDQIVFIFFAVLLMIFTDNCLIFNMHFSTI